MLKKVYKKIQDGNNNNILIYGSNRSIKLYSAVSPWERDRAKDENRKPNISPCFNYRNKRYFLDEFMCVDPHAPDWMKEFHGYTHDTFFSGVLVKLDYEGETVKAFTLIS